MINKINISLILFCIVLIQSCSSNEDKDRQINDEINDVNEMIEANKEKTEKYNEYKDSLASADTTQEQDKDFSFNKIKKLEINDVDSTDGWTKEIIIIDTTN